MLNVKHDAEEKHGPRLREGLLSLQPFTISLRPSRPSYSEEDTVSSFCETSRILCRALLFFSDHHSAPRKDFLRGFTQPPRLIQSPAKWIMANCYVRRPPPNQSRLGLRTGFCALVEISGGVRGKNYLQGIFQILEKMPSSVFLRPTVPFPLPQRPKKGILA